MIRWADYEIKKLSEVPSWLSDISLAEGNSVNDIISGLEQVVGYNRQILAPRIVMGNLYRYWVSGNIRVEKATQVLDWLGRHTPLSTEEKYIIAGLDDKIQLAKSKTFGDQKEVESEVVRFLKIYKDYNYEFPDQIADFHKTVETAIHQLFMCIRQEQAAFVEAVRKTPWWKIW